MSAVFLTACGGSGGDAISGPGTGPGTGTGGGGAVTVASVAVSPTTASVAAGATTTLTATVKDAAGNALSGQTVTWTSSDTGVATVSGGVVTGKAGGSATITATSGGKSGTAVVTVTVSVASVVVTPASKTMTYGDTTSFAATVRDGTGATILGRTVTWTSSDTTIATVNTAGVVTGQGAGSATISATSDGKTGTATITVTKAPVAQIIVSPSPISLKVGASQVLTLTLLDSSGNKLYGRTIAIVPSAAGIVTLQGGTSPTVVGQAAGTVTLNFSSESAQATDTVTVTQ